MAFQIENGVLIKYIPDGSAAAVIPEGVTAIAECAFHDTSARTGPESVSLPGSLQSIGRGAFWGCGKLTELEVPETVREIGDSAFRDCAGLEKVTLPASAAIDGNPFFGCVRLIEIQIFGEGPFSYVSDGALIDARSGRLIAYPAGRREESFTVPPDVKLIGCHAFSDCKSIKKLNIPDTVEEIEEGAFLRCGMREVSMPDGLTRTGREAFKSCESLEVIRIPDGTEALPSGIFYGCTSLRRVTLPGTLKVIGPCAFAGCSALSSPALPDSAEEIGKGAFTGCRMDSIKIPAGVRKLDMSSLSRVNDIELSGVPDAMYFYSCSRKSFTPAVTAHCMDFKDVPEDLRDNFLAGFFKDPDGYQGGVRERYVAYLLSEKKKLIPEIMRQDNIAVLRIFNEMGEITAQNYESVYLEAAQQEDAAQCIAWLLDWSAENVSFDDMLLQFKNELDEDPYSERELEKLWGFRFLEDGRAVLSEYKGEERNVTVPDHVGDHRVGAVDPAVFCPLRSGLDRKRADYFRNVLESVAVQAEITEVPDALFSGCEALKTVVLPESVTALGMSSFAGCRSLKSVNLPEGLKTVGNWAFARCGSLNGLRLPQGVEHIGTGCFD